MLNKQDILEMYSVFNEVASGKKKSSLELAETYFTPDVVFTINEVSMAKNSEEMQQHMGLAVEDLQSLVFVPQQIIKTENGFVTSHFSLVKYNNGKEAKLIVLNIFKTRGDKIYSW